MHDVMASHVARSTVPGMLTLVRVRGEVHVEAIENRRAGGRRVRLRTWFFADLAGLAAGYLDDSARYIERYKWIAYVGLLVILYVALKMIYEGWVEVAPFVNGATG